MPTRLFGRDPAMLIAVVYAVVMLLSTFAIRGIDEPLAVAIQMFLTAVATAFAAWKVRPVEPALFTGMIVAGANLLARFGFHLTEPQIAALTGLAAVVVMFAAARPQQTPVSSPAPIVAWAPPAEDTTLRR